MSANHYETVGPFTSAGSNDDGNEGDTRGKHFWTVGRNIHRLLSISFGVKLNLSLKENPKVLPASKFLHGRGAVHNSSHEYEDPDNTNCACACPEVDPVECCPIYEALGERDYENPYSIFRRTSDKSKNDSEITEM